MSDLLDQLYRLQDRIRFVESRKRTRDTVPSELTDVDLQYREKVEAVASLKRRLLEADIERRRAEADLAEHREKQKKYQTQLRNVQTSREYSAVLNEIDGVDKQIRAAEDHVLSLEEEIETARKDLNAREQEMPRETEEHEETLKDWRSAQRAINDELAAAQQEIQSLETEIPLRERSEFYRLMEKKGGLAIVRVANKSCSACHVKIRPAALQILKIGHERVYCDSCKRILYYDQQLS